MSEQTSQWLSRPMTAAIIANLLVDKENHCNFAKISFRCAINELICNYVINRLEIVLIDVIFALIPQTIVGFQKPNMAAVKICIFLAKSFCFIRGRSLLFVDPTHEVPTATIYVIK